jgi:hypothetical protein
MKIISVCYGPERTDVFDRVMHNLNKRLDSLQPLAITFSRHTEKVINKSALEYKNINFVRYCYKKGIDKHPNMGYLRKKEKKYNIGIYPVSEKSWLDIGQWGEYKKTLKKFTE